MNDTFFIEGKVFKYPGSGGWYFVETSDDLTKKLRNLSVFEVNKVGFGYIKVQAIIGTTSWNTTLFPQKNEPYLISIKESIRKKEEIEEGDTIRIECKLM